MIQVEISREGRDPGRNFRPIPTGRDGTKLSIFYFLGKNQHQAVVALGMITTARCN